MKRGQKPSLKNDEVGIIWERKEGEKPKKHVNENEDLLQEVQRLRMENEYLKKLNALVQEREKSEPKKESK